MVTHNEDTDRETVWLVAESLIVTLDKTSNEEVYIENGDTGEAVMLDGIEEVKTLREILGGIIFLMQGFSLEEIEPITDDPALDTTPQDIIDANEQSIKEQFGG